MTARNDKYTRLADRLNKAKQQKIKDIQDEWKKQFVEAEKKPTADREMPDGEKIDEGDEEVQREYEQQARQEKYTEFDGQKVYMAGLDVNLLKKQKQAIKSTSNKNTQDLLDRVAMKVKVTEKVNKASGNKLYRTMLANMFQDPPEAKCPIDLNSYYEFDIGEFGQAAPRKTIKRPGKFHKHPICPGLSRDHISQLEEMIERNQKRRELMAVFSSRVQPEEEENNEEQDSDDIFATGQKVEIEIGKKLDFGMEEEKPAQDTPPNPLPNLPQPQTVQDFLNQQQQLLKHQRQKKKRKLIQQQLSKPSYMQPADPYSECFWNTGPTLEQTNQLKKQGVVVTYQDQKEFKRREKKINYNKQYEKIQRIIAEKEQKK